MITITANMLPPRAFTLEERAEAGYTYVKGVWHTDGHALCSRPYRAGYMRMVDGRLIRRPAPPVCLNRAAVVMTKSGRYFCALHAPKKGERTMIVREPK